ncbi:MAG: hypothetical protein K2O58_05395 [Bacteroidales bacterium]|nr:hypothetical protein [Bacteroidales bacterium]MDE7127313.1 hypothetical protein [Bacteroidales bacterium]
MEIILTAKSPGHASHLLQVLSDEMHGSGSDWQWDYIRFGKYEEAIYYVSDDNSISLDKEHVMFVLEQENDKVVFAPACLKNARKASLVMCCSHVGHLTGMLLMRFYDDLLRIEINTFNKL